jgi:hypothetical protein
MLLNTRGAAAMQQLVDWLEKIGRGQYAPRFAENDITSKTLRCAVPLRGGQSGLGGGRWDAFR